MPRSGNLRSLTRLRSGACCSAYLLRVTCGHPLATTHSTSPAGGHPAITNSSRRRSSVRTSSVCEPADPSSICVVPFRGGPVKIDRRFAGPGRRFDSARHGDTARRKIGQEPDSVVSLSGASWSVRWCGACRAEKAIVTNDIRSPVCRRSCRNRVRRKVVRNGQKCFCYGVSALT